jgi:CRP-like cAMP-binding protein
MRVPVHLLKSRLYRIVRLEVSASLIRFFLIENARLLALACGGGFNTMSATLMRPVGNWVLDALPPEDYERLLPNVTPLSFSLGDVVYESGIQMGYVYFPTTCHVSLLYTMIDGATAEMGLVGKEGVVGVALFMGGETTPNRAVVQGEGEALRMQARAMLEEFKLGGPFQSLLLHYTQALMTQISQTAVCNRLHSVEQRLCRWLLMTRDRTHSDELEMTQEFLSHMLGVRREGVTHAAQALQAQGYISYMRGHLNILDRAGLEARVCECYGVVKAEHDRLRVHCANRRVGADRRSATDRRIGDNTQPPAKVRAVAE